MLTVAPLLLALSLTASPGPVTLDVVRADVRSLRVASLNKLAQEAQARAGLQVARQEAGALRTVLIPVNHARAEELAPLVRAQLSPRGKVAVDARTNTPIVTDVEP